MGGVDRLLQESAAAVGEGRSAWPSADDRSPDRGPFGLVNPNLTPTTAESLDGQSEDVVGLNVDRGDAIARERSLRDHGIRGWRDVSGSGAGWRPRLSARLRPSWSRSGSSVTSSP